MRASASLSVRAKTGPHATPLPSCHQALGSWACCTRARQPAMCGLHLLHGARASSMQHALPVCARRSRRGKKAPAALQACVQGCACSPLVNVVRAPSADRPECHARTLRIALVPQNWHPVWVTRYRARLKFISGCWGLSANCAPCTQVCALY